MHNLCTETARTPEQNAYRFARARCQNEADPNYRNYGKRGIKFLFESYEQFFAEVGPRPSEKHSLERKDNDGNYEPGNVKWATMKEQSNNRRTCHVITFQNQVRNLMQWAAHLGVKASLLYKRKSRGWCDACTLSFPEIDRGSAGNRYRLTCEHRSTA